MYKHALHSLTALIGIVLGMGNSHNKLLKKLSSTNEYVIYALVINSHNSDLKLFILANINFGSCMRFTILRTALILQLMAAI